MPSLLCQDVEVTAQNGITVVVELPLDAILTRAVNASVGPPRPGSNSTTAYQILTTLPLSANGTSSQIINATIASASQVNACQ